MARRAATLQAKMTSSLSTHAPIRMGVDALDQLVEPLPRGTSVCLVNEPGAEALALVLEALANHLDEGREVVYVCLDRSPETVRRRVSDQGGLDDEALEGLVLVDAFSGLLGALSRAEHVVEDPETVDRILASVEQAAAQHPDAVVLMDSLSGLVDRTSVAAVRARFSRLTRALSSFRLALVVFTAWPYEAEHEDLLESFDGVIRQGGVEGEGLPGAYLQIDRADWSPGTDDRERHLYKTVAGSGSHVHIPKILVTGPLDSGKSTFVRHVSDEAVSVDRLGTTVGLDHGRVTLDGVTADLFGTPGQARFDPVLEAVAGQALGVVIVVDATRPGTFDRARELLERTRTEGLPAIVAANKQDLSGALAPDEIRDAIGLPDDVEVVACSSQDPGSYDEILETITERILQPAAPP